MTEDTTTKASIQAAAEPATEPRHSAPWYPLQSGDVLHVHHQAASETPEYGETYVVEDAEDGDGQELRLLCHTAPDDLADITGYFEPGLVRSDPLLEPWLEAGPDRLTIVRHGRVVHGTDAR